MKGLNEFLLEMFGTLTPTKDQLKTALYVAYLKLDELKDRM